MSIEPAVTVVGAAINVKTIESGQPPHRRVVLPGSVVGGEWVATDMTNEPPIVQQVAADAWTEEVVAEYRARIEADAVVPPTVEDYRVAIQSHVDQAAQARRYDGGTSLASYVSSTNPAWASEAQVFVAWRDEVWAYAYAELAKALAGQREQPSVTDFLAELPVVEWPG